MLFGNDRLFSLVRSAKLGHVDMPPVLLQLRDWICAEYGVSVVHILFDHIDIGPATGRPRLNVILETDRDYDSWKTDAVTISPAVNGPLLAQFKKLAEAQTETYPNADRTLLVIDNFADACLGRACSAFLKNDVGRIIKKFATVPIWKIDGFSRELVVFLKAEKDVRVINKNGDSDQIRKHCFDAVKRYDEFNYLSAESFCLAFDSKENLDKKFHGNLFNYWR